MKDKKGGGKVIAQSVVNLGNVVYMPEKGRATFDQKLSLKFHKTTEHSNLLKPHAGLNLSVKSTLQDESEQDPDMSYRTATKTVDHRRYLSTTEKIVFDADQTLNFENDFESWLLDDSMQLSSRLPDTLSNSSSICGSEKKQRSPVKTHRAHHESMHSYMNLQKEIKDDFEKNAPTLEQSRNFENHVLKDSTFGSYKNSQGTLDS